MLHSAHQGCATPFKEKKSSFGGRKKAKPEKTVRLNINLKGWREHRRG
jgi:hypothetical protein